MNPSATPVTKDLVLVGGGHAHAEVLRSFGMNPLPGLRLTLVSPASSTPYSGMIPGYMAGRYTLEEAHIELRPLCRFAQAQFYQDAVTRIDPGARQLHFATRPPVGFDLLSLNIGSTPSFGNVKGARNHSLPVKPIDRFVTGWNQALEQAGQQTPFRVVVVGAGAGGVELSLTLQHRLRSLQTARHTRRSKHGPPQPQFHLVSQTPTVLPSHNSRVQSIFHRILQQRGIRLHLEQTVCEVTPTQVRCEGGDSIDADLVIWATDASAAPWIADSGIETDPRGFIAVNDCLQSISHPFIFAAGDIAAVRNHPRPKSGVFAVRQGPPLTRNLRRAFTGEPPLPFTPQKEFLSLISTGDDCAVASRGPWALEGAPIWKLKNWIDRRWMRQYQELPGMSNPGPSPNPEAPISTPAMRCGGCGAKVGSQTLSRVVSRISPATRPDVKIGLSAPDDAAVTTLPRGTVSVQTVDFFRSFISDPYIFGRITANHCLGDIYAMGAEPQSALAIATLPFGAPDRVEEQLFQLLSGANEVLRESGTALTGGHTAEGPELAFGLTVQGYARETQLLRKGGLQPGDLLLLTKPLGTGTLLAADMRQQARGEWIAHALALMQQPARQAAACLRKHHATACTDITGFGLLGHLHEMVKASAVHATLFLNRLPAIEGALDTIRAGILSSLQPANLLLRHTISNSSDPFNQALFQLLFDPQTAGGLLAGLPESTADACLKELHDLGYPQATLLGQISTARSPDHPITLV